MQAGSAWKGDAAPKFKLLEQTALNLSKLCTPWRLSADCRGADFRGAGEVLRRFTDGLPLEKKQCWGVPLE